MGQDSTVLSSGSLSWSRRWHHLNSKRRPTKLASGAGQRGHSVTCRQGTSKPGNLIGRGQNNFNDKEKKTKEKTREKWGFKQRHNAKGKRRSRRRRVMSVEAAHRSGRSGVRWRGRGCRSQCSPIGALRSHQRVGTMPAAPQPSHRLGPFENLGSTPRPFLLPWLPEGVQYTHHHCGHHVHSPPLSFCVALSHSPSLPSSRILFPQSSPPDPPPSASAGCQLLSEHREGQHCLDAEHSES